MTALYILGLLVVIPSIFILHYLVTFGWFIYKSKKELKDKERYKKMLKDVRTGKIHRFLKKNTEGVQNGEKIYKYIKSRFSKGALFLLFDGY